MASLKAAKQALRAAMKEKLTGLSQDSITSQSSQVLNSLTTFKPYLEAKRIAVYLSMPGGEIQTEPVVRHALSVGKQVFIPYLHKSGLPAGDGPPRLMDMVSLHDVKDYESLQPDKWGIPSIDPGSVGQRQRSLGELDGNVTKDSALDLILLPGVAFDRDPQTGAIRRLGHGRGFYDYFLHRYALASSERTPNGHPSVLLYALALKEQFLTSTSDDPVPVGPHDQPLDGVFLGDGSLKESAT